MLDKNQRLSIINDIFYESTFGRLKDWHTTFSAAVLYDWQMGRINASERDFKLECCEKINSLLDHLLSYGIDATDLWRENLKAWNLKQREEIKIGSFDHAAQMVAEGQEAIRNAHYKKNFCNVCQRLEDHYKGEF